MERIALFEEIVENVTKRVDVKLPVANIAEKVFEESMLTRVEAGIAQMVDSDGVVVSVGGRLMRDELGFTVYDVSGKVRFDGRDLELLQKVRLGFDVPALLSRFKGDKVGRPDMDLFLDGISVSEAAEIFESEGLEPQVRYASGGVAVCELTGQKGVATLINSKDSWQTKDSWPKIGFRSPISRDENLGLVAIPNVSMATLFSYPLEMGLNRKNPIDPPSYAAVARALLWSITMRDPRGRLLNLPFEETQRLMLNSISCTVPLAKWLWKHPEKLDEYGYAITDMALAVRLTELNTPDSYYSDPMNNGSIAIAISHPFYNQVSAAFWSGRGEELKFEGERALSPWEYYSRAENVFTKA